jgi:cell wall-associated NlpC family hydrolase
MIYISCPRRNPFNFIHMVRHKFIFSCSLLLFLCSCSSTKKVPHPDNGDIIIESNPVKPAPFPTASAVRFDSLQMKYARFLNTSPAQIQNMRLYQFIDQWLYTPYKWGGDNEKGIDCSAFMQKLLSQVYNIEIPRTSVQQFFTQWIDRFGSTRYLSEGDLVFFRTMDDKIISHVGLYLNNRMFVNSSSSKGVSIACLDDPYWKRCFVGAGRVKLALLPARKQ